MTQEYTGKQGSYLYNVALSFDCFVNALFNGSFRESLSSRCYRLSKQGFWYAKVFEKVLNFIFSPWDKEHCKESYEAALARGDAPKI